MPIDAVIFDIGNVLIEWQPENFYDRTIGADRRKAFFAATDMHKHHEQVDAGVPLLEMVETVVALHPDWEAEIRMWHDNWNDLAAPAIPHSVRLLDALNRNNVPVFRAHQLRLGQLPDLATGLPLPQDLCPRIRLGPPADDQAGPKDLRTRGTGLRHRA